MIHDPITQIVVLQSRSSSSLNNGGIETTTPPPPSTSNSSNSSASSLVDIQIIKISSIRDIRVINPKREEGFKPYEAKPITLQDYELREEMVLKRVMEEEKRLGVGVTVEGHKIYDAFAKTYLSPFLPPQVPLFLAGLCRVDFLVDFL